MGLNMKERQAVTREYRPCYQKATRKEKKTALDEFTRLTGCHRKSAVRLLGAKPAKQATVHANGRTVKLKPEKRRPGNRKGRPVYGDEAIGSLRKVWAFFRHKRGKILAPLLREQIARIASWPAFGIAPEIAAKLAG